MSTVDRMSDGDDRGDVRTGVRNCYLVLKVAVTWRACRVGGGSML